MEKYSIEKAQEEASKMRDVVTREEAQSYDEAQRVVESKSLQEDENDMQEIYRGIWADKLKSGERLLVGGSIFTHKLTTELALDFDSFDEQLNEFTREKINAMYAKNKTKMKQWLESTGSDVDPYTYYIVSQVQWKMQKLLAVDIDGNTDERKIVQERAKVYAGDHVPQLSRFVGRSACAERAALGQYMLQKIGMNSVYMSGVTMNDAESMDEPPENHSFIILDDPQQSEKTFVFDISRPRSQHNLPRLSETDIPFSYALFNEKDDLLVGSTEVLQGGRLWFGVGDDVCKQHEIVKINKSTK